MAGPAIESRAGSADLSAGSAETGKLDVHQVVRPSPPVRVLALRCRLAPGPAIHAPIAEHRVIVHASAATWSACRATGASHLRRWGDIDLIPGGQEGGFDAQSPCEQLEIRIAPDLLGDAAEASGATFEMRHMLRDQRAFHLVRALCDPEDEPVLDDILYAESIGTALLRRLAAPGSPARREPPTAPDARLARVVDYIRANLDQRLTIGRIAGENGTSHSHLRSWFRASTGMTVHRYLMVERVRRARDLLVEGRSSLSEVAWATGFSHQSHMAWWIRRELGCSPREIRSGLRRPGS